MDLDAVASKRHPESFYLWQHPPVRCAPRLSPRSSRGASNPKLHPSNFGLMPSSPMITRFRRKSAAEFAISVPSRRNPPCSMHQSCQARYIASHLRSPEQGAVEVWLASTGVVGSSLAG